MDEDLKEEEEVVDERKRGRIGLENESPTLELQKILDSLIQFKVKHDPKNEFFNDAMLQFYNINVTMDTEHVNIKNMQLLYNKALKTISQKDEELQRAKLQCHQMAEQINKYKQKYRIDAVNDDNKEDEIISDTDEMYTEKKEEITENISLPNQSLDSLHSVNQIDKSTDNDLLDIRNTKNDPMIDDNDDSDSNASDDPLITHHVTFKPPDQYQPISFQKYVPITMEWGHHDELDGVQSDWEDHTLNQEKDNNNNNEEEEEEDEDDEDGEEEDVYQLMHALKRLDIENEKLRDQLRNKCIECDDLKRQLSEYKKT